MASVQASIRRLGGVARLGELRACGHPSWYVRMLAEYGRILRVRKGWYANLGTNGDALRAWRVGGRLCCTTALAFYGFPDADAGRLHVCVPLTASRLRSPDDHRTRLAQHPDPALVVHWENLAEGDNRLVVPLIGALAQARACRPRSATSPWRDSL